MQAERGRTDAAAVRHAIARDGYALLQGFLNAGECAGLAARLPQTAARAGGTRNVPSELHCTDALDAAACQLMDRPAFAVRAILFDKTPQSNWAVPWHQDLAIPVHERHDLPGYRAWSLKEGVWHVQPPPAVLDAMLTLRLHLDDCTADNAPLQVVPGSHALGRIGAPATAALLEQRLAVTCAARAGDVLAMRPLLLHASAKARQPRQRRVLHVEYAAQELPAPLRWHRAWRQD